MWKPRKVFIPFRYDGHPNTIKEQTMSVTSANYVELAMRTQANQQKVLDRLVKLGPKAMQLDNAIRGLCNDCGELAEPIKAWIEYGKDDALDKVNMKEEVGDVLWRLAQICDALDFSIEDCMEANIRKLATRYGDKYSDVKAWNENRDRAAERTALEEVKQDLVNAGHSVTTIPAIELLKTHSLCPHSHYKHITHSGYSAQCLDCGRYLKNLPPTYEQTGAGWEEPAEDFDCSAPITKSPPTLFTLARRIAETYVEGQNLTRALIEIGRAEQQYKEQSNATNS